VTTRDENHEYALAIIEAKNAEIRAKTAELRLAEAQVHQLRAELTQAKLLKPRTAALSEAP
jgi:multidrug resistance efflux pump